MKLCPHCQGIVNRKKGIYCTHECKVQFNNNKESERRKALKLNPLNVKRRRGKRLSHPHMPAKDILVNFLSTRL